MFIAAQFAISNPWNQPRCPSKDAWIKKTMGNVHIGVLFSHKEGQHYVIYREMDGTGEYYAKRD